MNASRIRAKKVFQTAAEEELLVKTAARIRMADPRLPWGRLLIQASNEGLPANRRPSETGLLQHGKARYQNLVEAEMEAQLAESVAKSIAARQEAEKIEVTEVEPIRSAIPKLDEGSYAGWMETAADMMAQDFRKMLLSRFRPVASEVFNQIGREIEGSVKDSFFSKENEDKKLKVAFVGNSTDNLYFQKVAHGFEDVFEFVPVQALKDVHKFKDCTAIMFSSTSNKTLINAAKALNGAADMMMGKSSPDLRTYLWKAGMTEDQRLAFGGKMPDPL